MSTNNAAHTPGPWSIHPDNDGTIIGPDFPAAEIVGKVNLHRGADAEANARLIAEAGTVASETGLTPRQLAEQRAELLEALRLARSHIAATGYPLDSKGNYDSHGEWDFNAMTGNGNATDAEAIKAAFQVLTDAIAKATGGAA